MSRRWRWFLPGYLWALPHTLIGVLLALVYRSHSFRFHQGALVCIGGVHTNGVTRIWGRPGAQTHGWLVIFASEQEYARPDLRAHEYTHVVQGFIGGPLYVVLYGALFLYHYLRNVGAGWHVAYRRNLFERHAYSVGDHYSTDDWGV